MFRKILVAYIVVMLLALAFVMTAGATGQETCPDGGAWNKVDGLSGFTYTYTPPPGYFVTDNCYKHSTYVHFGTGDTVVADEHCSWKWVGWQLKYVCTTHELSHASFKIEEIPVRLCEDEGAYNYGEPLPCVYDVCPNLEGLQEEIPVGYVKPGQRCIPAPEPPPLCEDEEALNFGKQLPCEYPPDDPPVLCEDETALNTGEEGECEYPPPPCQEKNSFYLWYDGWCKIRVFSQYWTGTMAYPNAWSQNGYCECGYFHTDGWTWTYHSNCQENTVVYKEMKDEKLGCGFKECE